ncbi:hypothetical protein [Carnobacterium maltaromaticum]|uniref:hypothetical protein n=1 Tax=Carnobacterium maltaromaticum TaxID=2751 RepID=UPI00295EBC2F|nr:hypothetical protein [Carnobacterium maltaromaticum]
MCKNNIEMHWDDVFIYSVCFQVLNSKGHYQDVEKLLIFNQEYQYNVIVNIIMGKFNKVQSIKNIECWSEGLQLK